jgi:hypothetical protein
MKYGLVLELFASDFVNSDGDSLVKARVAQYRDRIRRIEARVECTREFELSSGANVRRPFLKIELHPKGCGNESIGIGIEKAKAVLAVSEQLRDWVQRDRTGNPFDILGLPRPVGGAE